MLSRKGYRVSWTLSVLNPARVETRRDGRGVMMIALPVDACVSAEM